MFYYAPFVRVKTCRNRCEFKMFLDPVLSITNGASRYIIEIIDAQCHFIPIVGVGKRGAY